MALNALLWGWLNNASRLRWWLHKLASHGSSVAQPRKTALQKAVNPTDHSLGPISFGWPPQALGCFALGGLWSLDWWPTRRQRSGIAWLCLLVETAIMPTEHQTTSVGWVAKESTGCFLAGPSQPFLQQHGADLAPFHVDGYIGVILHLDDAGNQSCIHGWLRGKMVLLENLFCFCGLPCNRFCLLVEISVALPP